MFSAEGRLWALDPTTGVLACVLDNAASGSFLLGPQGNRVLLDGFQIAGWGTAPPAYPATGLQPAAVGWSRPQGTAIIYSNAGDTRPHMFFLGTGHTIAMQGNLPAATYLEFAYHPTGLAIGYILKRQGSEAIWYSLNNGKKAKPLVFTKEQTTFSDLTFSRDGGTMYYIAHHRAGYSELHFIDLTQPKVLRSLYKSPKGVYWRTFTLSPGEMRFAVTEGADCSHSVAKVLPQNFYAGPVISGSPLIPDATRPTTALGWINTGTILVGEGGCGAPMDLYAVRVKRDQPPKLLASGVDGGSFRDSRPTPPTSLPVEVRLASGPGVG
jgi:hypothetical protein